MKTIDKQDWTPFGEGGFGVSYYHNTDPDIMLKLYKEGMSPDLAVQEYERSQNVFAMGISTPRAIELVTDGQVPGIIFERLYDKKSYSRLVADDESILDDSARELARCAHQLHATPCRTDLFSSQKELMRHAFEQCDKIDDTTRKIFYDTLDRIPDVTTCLHGDFHFGNAVLSRGKTYFIDLGDFAYGDPRLDLSEMKLCTTLMKPERTLEVFHMPKERLVRYWQSFLGHYYDVTDPEELAFIDQSLTPFMALNMAFIATKIPNTQILFSIAQQLLTT